MWPNDRFIKLCGIELPIIQAPMLTIAGLYRLRLPRSEPAANGAIGSCTGTFSWQHFGPEWRLRTRWINDRARSSRPYLHLAIHVQQKIPILEEQNRGAVLTAALFLDYLDSVAQASWTTVDERGSSPSLSGRMSYPFPSRRLAILSWQ